MPNTSVDLIDHLLGVQGTKVVCVVDIREYCCMVLETLETDLL